MKKITVLATAIITASAIGLGAVYYVAWLGAENGIAAGEAGDKPRKKKSGRKPGQPKPYAGDLPSIAALNIRNAVLEKRHSGLDYPWAMEFISDSELLITEFGGSLQRLDLATDKRTPVQGLPGDIATGKGQIGLMDIALHPGYADNGVIYLSHAVEDPAAPGMFTTAVTRAVLEGDKLTGARRIFLATPYGKSNSNFGGALEFDDRGFLFIGTGDRSQDIRSQKPDHLNGKIIRLTDTGEIPPDNPFVGDPTVDDRIYALGVRNPQGLVFDPVSRRLFETEHGPMGGDEVNLIEAGRNYGWPTISYGANYNTQKKGIGTARAGLEQPLFYYLPSIATSPLTIYRGAMFPEWEGNLLVGALKSQHINMLDLAGDRVLSEQRLLKEFKGRVRDIKVARDGSIYFLLQNGGRVYRLYRDTTSADLEQPEARNGATVFRTVCASCHAADLPGIPQVKDSAAWVERLRSGRQTLYRNTIDGIGAMPPKGLCDNCSEEEVRAAVDYLLRIAGAKDARAAPPAPAPPDPAPPPNFVILIADDMSWDDIGAYGNSTVQTPNIDRLSAAGLRFDNAFLTTSSCSASRASILTGRYPHSNGLAHLHQWLPEGENTLGLLLREGGYYTAAVGKWHIGPNALDQFSIAINDKADPATGRWLEVLRGRPPDQPFFLWLASRDPHRPHPADGATLPVKYDPATIAIPAGFADGPRTRQDLAGYFGEVTRFDRDVGQVVQELERQGLLENTLVIVMSDNGRPFHGGKTTLYDDGIKTPFVLHWPAGLAQAGTRQQLISMVDLAPTLLELAGLAIPGNMQGLSFAGALQDPFYRTRDYIFAERNWHTSDAHERVVRSLDFLYKENQFPTEGECRASVYGQTRVFVEFATAHGPAAGEEPAAGCFAPVRPKRELFAAHTPVNILSPDLSGAPEHREVLERMSAVLAEWRRQTGDFDYAPFSDPRRRAGSERPPEA